MNLLFLSSLFIIIVANIWYIVTIFTEAKKPSAFSWLLVSIINGVIFLSLVLNNKDGDKIHLATSLLYFILPLTIFFIAVFNKSVKEEVNKNEVKIILGLIAITVILYFFVDKPLVLLIGGIIGDICAAYPTIKKSWKHPDHEPIGPWLLDAVGFAISVLYSTADTYAFIFYLYAAIACFLIGIIPIIKKTFFTARTSIPS